MKGQAFLTSTYTVITLSLMDKILLSSFIPPAFLFSAYQYLLVPFFCLGQSIWLPLKLNKVLLNVKETFRWNGTWIQ